MLSEADDKYVWKNSIFKSNTLSIIPWFHYIGTSIEGYSSIFEWDKNTNYGTVTIEKVESAQYLNGIYIERKK